jgi:hypothetical protein
MADGAAKIAKILSNAGYGEQGWYLVERQMQWSTGSDAHEIIGFAVITRMERITDQGSIPTDPRQRWSTSADAISTSGFADTLTRILFGAPAGRYRVFLLHCSLDPVGQLAGTFVTEAQLRDALQTGSKSPPNNPLRKISMADATITGFVYEFLKNAVDGQAQLVADSPIGAKQHFEAAGLLSSFQNK